MNRLLRPLIALGLLVVATPSFGWVDTGHMVIAAIAEGHLKPEVLKACEELLKSGGTDRTQGFVAAACWADDTKDSGSGKWHYIDLPWRTDGKPTRTQPATENVVWAINHYAAILKDASQPIADRANALRYLIHFVADVHQPLHASTRESEELPEGDHGGVEFKIQAGELFKWMERPPTDLHVLWDMGAGLFRFIDRPLNPQTRGEVLILGQNLTNQYSAVKLLDQVKDLNPQDWAEESLSLAKNIAYMGVTPGGEPDLTYVTKCKTISGQRAALAGYRLAGLLNSLLGSKGTKPGKGGG